MKTVLVIDDNSEFRNLMGEILRANGWRVLEAGEGEAGLALVRQHRPLAVLCDLLMPRGNGFHVCHEIRADANLRHIKIIVTSGRDYEADRVAAREAGADAYLTKPVRPDVLVRLINEFTEPEAVADLRRPFSAPGSSSPARLKFWGVRGSISTPGPGTVHYGGNTTCVEIRAGNEIIILDAGTGLRPLGRALLAEFQDKPLNLTLLLTHTHWDHIQGLPFFAPIYQPQCRLRILGFEGARKGLLQVLSGQMESPYFPVPFGELPGNVEIEELKDLHFQIGPVRVQAWFANHPGICVGYRLFTEDGSFAFFPDNEPHARHREASAALPSGQQASREFCQTEELKMIEFLRGTDVLVLDAQYDRDEYKRHAGWGHGCVDDAVMMAVRAEARKLFLFHHDPDHTDEKIFLMVEDARRLVAEADGKLQVDAAREGLVVELPVAAKK